MTDEQFEELKEMLEQQFQEAKFNYASILVNTMRIYDIFWLWLYLEVDPDEAKRLKSLHASGRFECPPPFIDSEEEDVLPDE